MAHLEIRPGPIVGPFAVCLSEEEFVTLMNYLGQKLLDKDPDALAIADTWQSMSTTYINHNSRHIDGD